MKYVIPFLISLFLIGCFGTDNNSSSSLSGTVADGYIENATVCFDSNGNLSCDDNEPTTTTAADGSYSVTANGSVDGLSVIAVVGPDSKDADDGGLTMSEAGKEGFNFMAPAANPKVVSPLSTLVQFEIISNPDFSLDEAQGAVKETLGIDNDNVNLLEYDFVEAAETGDSFATNIKNVTEVLSSALGDVTKNMSDDSAIADLKAGGNDGMKAFQTGIMDMIKETVIPQTVAGGAVTGTVDDIKKQLKGAFRPNDCGANDCNKSGSLVSGFQTAVTAKKKAVKVAATAGAQTISDVKALMENGIIIGRSHDESYLARDGETAVARDESGLFVEYFRMQGENEYYTKKILVEQDGVAGGTWYDPVVGMVGSIEFDDNWTMNPKTGSWSPGDIPMDDSNTGGSDGPGEQPTFTKGCMSFGTGFSDKLCFKERNLSGKTIASVMCPDGTGRDTGDFCEKLDGVNATFKDGSKGLDVSMSYNFDLYQVHIDPCIYDENSRSCSTGFQTARSEEITDVDNLVTSHTLTDAVFGYIGNDCNIAFTFENSKILFADGGSCSSKSTFRAADEDGVESLSYEIKTIGSSKVLLSGVPQIFRENNPDDLPIGAKILFAAVPTNATSVIGQSRENTTGMRMFNGYFVASGVSQKFSFDTGDEKIGTYQFLDSIQEALRWDEFPYPTKVHEHTQPYIPGSGGSEQECLTWIGNSNREPLPGFGCFDFCSSNERHATCVGDSNSVCTVIDTLVAAGTLSRDEPDIWGCPGGK